MPAFHDVMSPSTIALGVLQIAVSVDLIKELIARFSFAKNLHIEQRAALASLLFVLSLSLSL